jgi:hypothetical protein
VGVVVDAGPGASGCTTLAVAVGGVLGFTVAGWVTGGVPNGFCSGFLAVAEVFAAGG